MSFHFNECNYNTKRRQTKLKLLKNIGKVHICMNLLFKSCILIEVETIDTPCLQRFDSLLLLEDCPNE